MTITNGYTTRNDVKAALRIPLSDTQDDDLIDVAVESASREIDGYCERVFYSTTETRVYIPQSSFLVETDDISTLTTLKTSPDGEEFSVTWAESDRQLEPLNGIAGGLTTPFTRIRAIGDYLFPIWDPRNVNAHEATVQVTGTFGWTATPKAVEQACILLSMRLFKRLDAPLGAVGFGDIGVVRVSRIDPDIESLLSPYRRVRMA
jgi:hypothetical protein